MCYDRSSRPSQGGLDLVFAAPPELGYELEQLRRRLHQLAIATLELGPAFVVLLHDRQRVLVAEAALLSSPLLAPELQVGYQRVPN